MGATGNCWSWTASSLKILIMRLEVMIENEEPQIYNLNKAEIVVGSSPKSDIVIPHASISRRHVSILVQNDQYFVLDHGSTNGSFINEGKLAPGSKVEFTTFFPVRLGGQVLLTLLSDDVAQDSGFKIADPQSAADADTPDDGTRAINVKDLHKMSTKGLVQKRAKTIQKIQKPIKAPAPAAGNSKLLGLGLMILIGALVYYVQSRKDEATPAAEAIVVGPTTPIAAVDNRPILKVSETELPSPDKVLEGSRAPKCSNDLDKYLCAMMPNIFQGHWGAVQSENLLSIFGDGQAYLARAKNLVKAPPGDSEQELRNYQDDLNLVMIVLWVHDNVPGDLNSLEKIKDKALTLAMIRPVLFQQQQQQLEEAAAPVAVPAPTPTPGLPDVAADPAAGSANAVSSETTVPIEKKPVEVVKDEMIVGVVFVPESLIRLRKAIRPEHFEKAKLGGAAEFAYAAEYFRYL